MRVDLRDRCDTLRMDEAEFLVDDQQREAAVTHLQGEHARGSFDHAELARRTAAAREARTVSELLAATAEPTATTPPSQRPRVRTSVLALLAGLAVAVVLALLLLSRLG